MRRSIRWVPESAVRAIHAGLIAEHGGRGGLREAGLLSSALARPRNKKVYGAASSLFDLAAAYGVAIARNHPFIDGNKRVALALVYVFLEMNGVRLEASEKDAVEVMLAIDAGQMDERELSVWIRTNSVSFLK